MVKRKSVSLLFCHTTYITMHGPLNVKLICYYRKPVSQMQYNSTVEYYQDYLPPKKGK